MNAMPAVVLTHAELSEIVIEASKNAAEQVVADLRVELIQDPHQKTILKLREYIADPTINRNPREYWADSYAIRQVQPTEKGDAKSVSWFMKFQKATGLKDCIKRKSPRHGRAHEWCFEDIRHAWQIYYQS